MTGQGMYHGEHGISASRMRRSTVEGTKGRGFLSHTPFRSSDISVEVNDRVIHVWKDRIIPYYRKLSQKCNDACAKVFQELWHAEHNIQPCMSYLSSVATSPIPDVATGHRP
jgi:hypothetical protein